MVLKVNCTVLCICISLKISAEKYQENRHSCIVKKFTLWPDGFRFGPTAWHLEQVTSTRALHQIIPQK